MSGPLATRLAVASGETTIGMVDRLYQPTGTRKGVIVTHGATVLATAFAPGGAYYEPVALAANAGYPCLAIDAGGANTWGNDTEISAVTADKTVLQAAPYSAKTGGVFFYGSSMGALGALNWARANAANVLGMFLTIPVLDLNDIYQNDKGSFRAAIGTAYGVTYPTAIPGLSTHSPAAYNSTDLAALATIPAIQTYASDNDPIASNTTAAAAWAATVGSNVTVTSMGNVGHSAASLDPFTLTRWLDAHSGRT